MSDSLASRLRRQAQELLDLAELIEPCGAEPSQPSRRGRTPNPRSHGGMLLVRKAVALFGTQQKLAEACGTSQPQIQRIADGKHGVSAELARAISDATKGEVPHWKLRPDLWDAPAETEVA